MAMVTSIRLANIELGTAITISENNALYVLEKFAMGQLGGVYDIRSSIGIDGTEISDVRFGARTVTIVGWVIGNSDKTISLYRKALNQIVNPKHILRVEFDVYAIEGIAVSTVAYGTEHSVLNDRMCRFMITLYCKTGLISDKYRSTFTSESRTKELVFPLDFVIPTDSLIFGTLSVSQLITVINNGHVPTRFAVTFTASGVVVNPSIINIDTQEFIKINETLQDGDILIVSTENLVAKVTKISGGIETNVFNSVSNGTTWFEIPLGTVPIGYTAESGAEALAASIAFSARYLEVL